MVMSLQTPAVYWIGERITYTIIVLRGGSEVRHTEIQTQELQLHEPKAFSF